MVVRRSLISLAVLFLAQWADGEVVASACFGSTDEFLLLSDSVQAASATQLCDQNGATFGRISSLEEHEAVVSLLDGVSIGNFWVGITDAQQTRGGSERFTYVDGVNNPETLAFIHVPQGTFPWNSGEPNDDRDCGFFGCSDSVEFCVEWIIGINRFNDNDCSQSKSVLCRRPCTDITTSSPTTADVSSGKGPDSADLGIMIGAIVVLVALLITTAFSWRHSHKMKKLSNELKALHIELGFSERKLENQNIGEESGNPRYKGLENPSP